MQLIRVVEVESDGATWKVGQPVTGGALMDRAIDEAERHGRADEDILAAAFVYFCEAIRDWSGIVDQDGNSVPFSHAVVADIPNDVKLRVVTAARKRRAELLGKGARPVE